MRVLRSVLASDATAAFDDLLKLSNISLTQVLAESATKLLQEVQSCRSNIKRQLSVVRKIDTCVDEQGKVRPENLWRLKEVCECLENCREQIILLDVDGAEDEWNQVWVFLENFYGVSSLCQVVNGDNGKTLKTGVFRLQVLLDNWVQLIVVCCDVRGREVLDHHTEKHHGELFFCQVFSLSVGENELEKFGPLFLRNKNLS